MTTRKHPTIGCCGIDCGLCPRYYTKGASRCPGCGGDGFALKHPSCSFITCCHSKRGLNVCAECGEYPCQKCEKDTGEHDSFVTHRRVISNQLLIKEIGIDAFLDLQAERIAFLETALERYDDGKSKNFLCLAATLLSIQALNESLSLAEKGEPLRDILTRVAEAEQQELKLRK